MVVPGGRNYSRCRVRRAAAVDTEIFRISDDVATTTRRCDGATEDEDERVGSVVRR